MFFNKLRKDLLTENRTLTCHVSRVLRNNSKNRASTNRQEFFHANTLYYKTWVNKGILKVRDPLDTYGQSLSLEFFKSKFRVRSTFHDCGGALAATPKIWKSDPWKHYAGW